MKSEERVESGLNFVPTAFKFCMLNTSLSDLKCVQIFIGRPVLAVRPSSLTDNLRGNVGIIVS